ncbi:unnamed protein product [Nippostrongylus brasiliensis]|uniref:EGF-like domain-containing protein n=1 Tax=Nippostrongylus brasiliensis TaxID=27835 RepID=A0A0N4YLC5_NIPBR|nr:unnamed protein product [Nippostrongylus brasiliensis]
MNSKQHFYKAIIASRGLRDISGDDRRHKNKKKTKIANNLQCRVDDPLSCNQAKHEYKCECPTGVNRLPDGRCLSVDECARPSLNNCHKDANCIDKVAETTALNCLLESGFRFISLSSRKREKNDNQHLIHDL